MNSKKKKMLKRAIPLYIMVAPGFIYLLINNYIPMLGIVIAFKNLNFSKGILKSDWAGLSNFEYLFKAPDAFLITRNTILYNVAFIVVNTVVAIVIAIILSEIRSKMKVKIFQSCVLIPSLISIIIVSYLAYAFLSGRTGFINGSLAAAGKDTISFYTEPKYWPAILIFINCWKGAGYSSIIYLAAILGIDQEMYEAAEIDGATRWNKIRFITLPMLKSTVITLTLMNVGRIFYSDFGLFYQVPMNSGALINATNTIDTYVYRGLIELGDISMSSAACVYQSLVGFVLVLTANWVTKKLSSENALF
ncbi:sugar ABC transporter permease [Blautia sp. OF03-15BH]|uniref:ABC transporter permease n=1 Tax=Blautia sp. OF03-15BH TaxID=2292287 RepID=UPI000E4F4496|nr:ABC transporter permease subunit [Blautia sp. OF03-15BH]RGY01013.1 sugar ABC transporter permease [Blautia sp. OF03-15BH]